MNISSQYHNAKPREQGVSEIEENSAISSESQEIKRVEEDSDGVPEEINIQREDTTNQPIPKPPVKEGNERAKSVKIKTPEVTQPMRPKPPVRSPMKGIQLSLLEKVIYLLNNLSQF